MEKSKRGMETGTYVFILVAVIGGIVFFIFVVPLFGKTSGGAVVMLKRWAGLIPESDLEEQREAERVSKELKDNAEKIYSQFELILKKCINEYLEDTSCICGVIDFTQLNNYNLILSNDRGTSTLMLQDSNRVQVSNKRSQIGRLLLLHSSSGLSPNINLFNDYSQRIVYVFFSKDMVNFKLVNTDIEKYEGDMTSIFFRKFSNNMIAVDDSRYGTRDCEAEEGSFSYIRR